MIGAVICGNIGGSIEHENEQSMACCGEQKLCASDSIGSSLVYESSGLLLIGWCVTIREHLH